MQIGPTLSLPVHFALLTHSHLTTCSLPPALRFIILLTISMTSIDMHALFPVAFDRPPCYLFILQRRTFGLSERVSHGAGGSRSTHHLSASATKEPVELSTLGDRSVWNIYGSYNTPTYIFIILKNICHLT